MKKPRDCQRLLFHTYRHGIDVGSTGSDNGAALTRKGTSSITNHHDWQVIYPVPMRNTKHYIL